MRATRLVVLSGLLLGCGRIGFDVPGDGAITIDMTGESAPDDSNTIGVCDAVAEPDVVALYAMETDPAADVTSQHTGIVRGTIAIGPGRCGTAGNFDASYVLVPDSPAFELATGSVELFARTAAPARNENQALITRDASGLTVEGHVTVLTTTAGAVIARLQRGGTSYYRCAPVLPSNQWVHIGVSFGGAATQGLRMWVDHVEATVPTSTLGGATIDCTGIPPAGGIQGNTNTLVIGGSNANSAEGGVNPTVDQFWFGELDQVRIRSTWRDFSAP